MKDNLLRKFDQITVQKRKKILLSLLKMKPNFFEDIAYLAESPEETDRIKYIKMLDSENLANAMKDYRKLASDPNPKVRATAIKGFTRVGDMDVRYKLIRRYFDDPDPRVRANTIELLPDEKPDDKEIVGLTRQAGKSDNRRGKSQRDRKVVELGFQGLRIQLS